MNECIRPSWGDIDRGSSIISILISDKIKSTEEHPVDYIVPASPEGMFPAIIISKLWDIPIFPASNIEPKVLPTIYGNYVSGHGSAPTLPNLLIVNHISSTYLDEMFEHYELQGHHVITAAMYHQENRIHLKPNYNWYTLDSNIGVIFPWENV